MPLTVTWDHLHLRSPDPEAAAEFYVRHFGGEITGRAPTPGGTRIMVRVAGLHLFIEHCPADTATPPEPPFRGLEHLGLAVSDLDAAVAYLKGEGVRFTMEPTVLRPELKIAFLLGPDNVSIELLQRG